MSSSGMGWDVHSVILSIQYFLCRQHGITIPGKFLLNKPFTNILPVSEDNFCFFFFFFFGGGECSC